MVNSTSARTLDMSDIKQQLIDSLGQGIVDASSIYAPALKRLTIQELAAWRDLVWEKKENDKAADLLRSKMTPEELTAEKIQLAVLTEDMANRNAEKWKFTNDLFGAILKTTATLLLSSGVLL